MFLKEITGLLSGLCGIVLLEKPQKHTLILSLSEDSGTKHHVNKSD